MNQLCERIRDVVIEHGRLGDVSDISEATDLYTLGMTSHATVAVMLALESAFDVEFPDELLTREVFESVQNIAKAVQGLLAADGGGAS